ncbi:hypothetical protein CERSUDRAFT_97522 [Gelatoporia subvermispora B]|uniref:Uncharacterized protein n=1 Tax=Ceriporiopsis subvermispora (strain B) TaxID=914234 RepID=M2QQ11_CERS8|nr:hypothetical protein CERSUDRAFT_97522 [Gelatoporia subvermispora B]
MSPSDLPKHGHEKRKNRYPKTFVDDKATALQLAETVAKVQEDKSLQKVRKHHHQAQKSRSVGTQKKERTSKRKLVDPGSLVTAIEFLTPI